MTKYAVAIFAVLISSYAASAQHIVESYRVVNNTHNHRVVTRVETTNYAPAYYAPVAVKQSYHYHAPGVKIRSKVNKRGEVRIREVYQNPCGGKQKVKYKSKPTRVYNQQVQVIDPVVYYAY